MPNCLNILLLFWHAESVNPKLLYTKKKGILYVSQRFPQIKRQTSMFLFTRIVGLCSDQCIFMAWSQDLRPRMVWAELAPGMAGMDFRGLVWSEWTSLCGVSYVESFPQQYQKNGHSYGKKYTESEHRNPCCFISGKAFYYHFLVS